MVGDVRDALALFLETSDLETQRETLRAARDLKQMVLRPATPAAPRGAGRANSDARNRTPRTLERAQPGPVHMTVEHQLGTAAPDRLLKRPRVAQGAATTDPLFGRRMMEEQHPTAPLPALLVQQRGQRLATRFAEKAIGRGPARRPRRVDSDQGDLLANPERRGNPAAIAVTPQIGPPGRGRDRAPLIAIGVVIARHQGHPLRRPELFQKIGGFGDLGGQTQMRQIAGDSNVIRALPVKIVLKTAPDLASIFRSPAQTPRQETHASFSEEREPFVAPRTHLSRVEVGDVGQTKDRRHFASFLSAPRRGLLGSSGMRGEHSDPRPFDLQPVGLEGVWVVDTGRAGEPGRSGQAGDGSDLPAPRFFGLTPAERLHRSLAPLSGERAGFLLFRGDTLFDEKLVRALAARPGSALRGPTGAGPVAAHVSSDQIEKCVSAMREDSADDLPPGLRWLRAEELRDHDARLRKAEPPLLLNWTDATPFECEAALFAASYKTITDGVTKWVWPRPALWVTRGLARAGISPNAVTAVSYALVILATALFYQGHFEWGLLAAWWMTFLDTVDGKLARVTLRSSEIGHVLDHGLDIVHPPIWYAAWALGLGFAPAWLPAAAAWVLGGYVAGRLLEGLFILIFGFETHSWKPIDSWFRCITARRNPNLVLFSLACVFMRPDLGFAAVAVWTASSLGFHIARFAKALIAHQRGDTLTPWYTADEGEAA